MIRRVLVRGLVGLLAAAGPLLVGAPGAVPAGATPARAVVVIDTGASVRTEVITFSGTVTGLEALRLAGADPVTYGYAGQGAGVCALDGVGHSGTDDCLGTAADPRYWSYWHAPAGAAGWTYARECACTAVVRDGDVEGWKFGTGARPPFRAFCDVVGCAPPPVPEPDPGGAAPAPPTGAGGVTPGPGVGAGSVGPTDPSGPPGPAADGPDGAAPDPGLPVTPTTTPAPVRVRTLGAGPRSDPGSPVGLLVALGVAVAAVSTTVLVRRRTR